MFEFRESTGKLGLKMTNKTHTDDRKMVQLNCYVSGCVISWLIFIFIKQSRSYGQARKHQRGGTALWLLRRGVATTHDFLGAQPKI